MSGTTLKELLELPVDDRFTLIEALWDSLAQSPESVPIPQWHLDELDRRLKALESGDVGTVPWSELRKELEARFGAAG